MLNENIKTIRKSKGFSQEELANRLNVVRQTVSKWELGLSVPDSEMLVSISKVLETPVSTLLGENILEAKEDNLKIISDKLEAINLMLVQRKLKKRKVLQWCFIILTGLLVVIFGLLILLKSFYLGWDYSNPETAVIGVGFHTFEWLFVRIGPFVLIGSIIGIFITGRKK